MMSALLAVALGASYVLAQDPSNAQFATGFPGSIMCDYPCGTFCHGLICPWLKESCQLRAKRHDESKSSYQVSQLDDGRLS